jgi:hypothetical protein
MIEFWVNSDHYHYRRWLDPRSPGALEESMDLLKMLLPMVVSQMPVRVPTISGT